MEPAPEKRELRHGVFCRHIATGEPGNRPLAGTFADVPFCRGSGLPDGTAGKTAPDLIHFPCIKSGQTSQRYLDNHRFRPFRTFRFTGIPAGSNKRYRDRIASLTFSKHTSKSSAFTSTITGFAPQCTITFAVAQYVYAGTITSSPSCTPNHRNTTSSPTVFEFTANVALFPQYAVNLRSNSFVFGPVVIQPDFKVSTTSSMTLWSILGGENGIIIINYFIY